MTIDHLGKLLVRLEPLPLWTKATSAFHEVEKATALVSAPLTWTATAMAQVPSAPARPTNGAVRHSTVSSTNVPDPVPITYYLSKRYDSQRAAPYPLQWFALIMGHRLPHPQFNR